jgi:zinc finger BED domain-containing protein 1 (E3 SUMO-protein ligase ZBED1)
MRRQCVDKPTKLIQYSKTRWNSIADMFARLLEHRWTLCKYFEDKEREKSGSTIGLALKDEQWDMLKHLTPLLDDLKRANTLLCGEKYVTLSALYPIIFRLKDKFSAVTGSEITVVKTFRRDILKQLETRFVSKLSDYILIAMMLDPRFSSMAGVSDDQRTSTRNRVCALLRKEARRHASAQLVEANIDTDEDSIGSDYTPTQRSQPEPEDSINSFFGESSASVAPAVSVQEQAEAEISAYLSETVGDYSVNPLTWWRDNQVRFPLLSVISKAYLCTPATSVASERHFSQAGLLINKKRSRLLPATAEVLLFVNHNFK